MAAATTAATGLAATTAATGLAAATGAATTGAAEMTGARRQSIASDARFFASRG